MTTQLEILIAYLDTGILLWTYLVIRNWGLAVEVMKKNGVKTPLVMVFFVLTWLPMVCTIAFRRLK